MPVRVSPDITVRPATTPEPLRRLAPDELCPQQKTDVGTKIRRVLRP